MKDDLASPAHPHPPPTQVEILVTFLEADPGKILLWGHQNLASPSQYLSLESFSYEIGLKLSKVQTFLKNQCKFPNCRKLKTLDRRGKILCIQQIWRRIHSNFSPSIQQKNRSLCYAFATVFLSNCLAITINLYSFENYIFKISAS